MYSKLKAYLTTPSKCFIPKCKAHCCTNAPLPEDFLPKHTDKIQRNIFSGVNIGQNDVCDTYNSIIYNTTPNPIQILGVDSSGKSILGIPGELMKKLQITTNEQLQKLIESYEQFDNYCPFITDMGRCNVYKDRPPICREFGTAPGRINVCKEKSSPLEIIKITFNEIFSVKRNLKETWNLLKSKFSKQ